MKTLRVRSVRTSLLVLFVTSSLAAFGQSGTVSTPPTDQNAPVSQSKSAMSLKQEPDDLKQELDSDAMALSKIPADPLINSDPFASIFQPVNKLTDAISELERLKFGATYTFLNQNATVTPGGVCHDQLSGCRGRRTSGSAAPLEHRGNQAVHSLYRPHQLNLRLYDFLCDAPYQ